MSGELEPRRSLIRRGERALMSAAAVGSIAIGLAVAAPPAVRAIRAPAPAALRVVFGEALRVAGRSAQLAHQPTGGVALFVGGVRQAEETFRVAGSEVVFFEAPVSGEKVTVDYAY